jgi:hypothetical protein
MKTRIVCPSVVAWSLLFLGAVQSQTPYQPAPPADNVATIQSGQDYPSPPPEITPEPPGRPSPYILYHQGEGCYCPVGGNGPVRTELYLDNGISFPIGNNVLGHTLDAGWDVTAGARTLFFNPAMDRAWFVDLGVTNIHNVAGTHPDETIPLSIIVPDVNGTPTRVNFGSGAVPGVTIHTVNQTFANFGLGGFYYFTPANSDSWHFRLGLDTGGRWGTENITFNEIRHRSHTAYGYYVAGIADLEIPCGCCVFTSGLRLEYDYTWCRVLQDTSANNSEINLLFTVGVRF